MFVSLHVLSRGVVLQRTAPQWQNVEQREAYQCLVETVAVLHRLTTRLSSRAEIVGAVRQVLLSTHQMQFVDLAFAFPNSFLHRLRGQLEPLLGRSFKTNNETI